MQFTDKIKTFFLFDQGVPNLAGSLFDNQLMMSGLEGSSAGGNNCNLGKDDAAFCAGSLFSDGKVSQTCNFLWP
jgi:hypothetical protein